MVQISQVAALRNSSQILVVCALMGCKSWHPGRKPLISLIFVFLGGVLPGIHVGRSVLIQIYMCHVR